MGEGLPVAASSWTEDWGHWRRRWLPAPLFRISLFLRTTYGMWVFNNQLGKLYLSHIQQTVNTYYVQRQ